MDNNLFIDNTLNDKYHAKGYLHIPDFLNSEEVLFLKTLYNKKEKSFFDKGFHRTLDKKDYKVKIEISQSISSIVSTQSEKYLLNYRCLLNSFMTKEKGADIFDIHQNWTFVEEDKFTSLVIWIPLQDVNEENGTMYFIPGSDKWNKGIRGNNIPWQYEHTKHELFSRMVPVPMKAGDAVIFDDATIHYTSANKSSKPRISIAQVMIPKKAKPVFYNKDVQKNIIEKYEISDEFYYHFTDRYLTGNMQDMKLVDSMPA